MRGNPFIRLFIVIALFAVAAFPLWQLTAGKTFEPVQATAVVPEATQPTRLEVTCSQPANEFIVRHLGKVVWQGKGLRAATELPLPSDSFDLQVEAAWNPVGEAENAFRLQVIRDEMPLLDSTLWARDRIEDTITVPIN